MLRPRDLGHRAAGRAGLPHGLQPAARARLERPMTDRRRLTPGRRAAGRLARHLSRRRRPRSTRPAAPADRGQRRRGRRASSPRASRSTASTPASASWPACASTTADLGDAPAQHRAVARRRRRRADAGAGRAADDGAEAREPGAGRLGRAAGRRSRCWRRCSRAGLIPVIPAQGSVGASGDLAPLAHMAAAMIGVGEIFVGGERMPAAEALAAAGLAPLALGPKEGLALLNGTQFSTAYALAGAVRGRDAVRSRRWSPARSRPTPPRAPTRRSIRASTRCAAIAGQIEAAAALRALMAGSADPRLASRRRRRACRTPTACAASRR